MITDPGDIRHGARIGRFVVVGELGKGGMGVVYAAHDPELDRQVALKVLRAAEATDEERVRMQREGQAMARITHPNVITVYDVGVEGTLVFLAQELLDGGTLGEWLEKKPRSSPEIIDKFVAAGHGLAAAHAAGLVHRDFKPDNVLLGKDGRVRVSDFGLARALEQGDDNLAAATRANIARAQLELSRSPMSPLTRTGAVMGTPMFMAPEQHNGERADERTDQFAFCVALYHALYGDWPFEGKTSVALADNVIAGRMKKPPAGASVPARLRKLLLRGLATRPADRFPSMEALLDELARPPSHRLRNVALALGALVLVAGGGVAAYILLAGEHAPAPRAPVAFDPKTIDTDKAIEWLSSAIERGELDDAAEKYDMAAALQQQAGQPTRAAIAWSADALVLALRGKLEPARAKLQQAEAAKGDVEAVAYVDMATAALASAQGELQTAYDRSAKCANGFAPRQVNGKEVEMPELRALCLELHGAAAAELGDRAAARKAYEDGLAAAKRVDSSSRTTMLELGIAALDLDDDQTAQDPELATRITKLQTDAHERGATSPEVRAWVLLARVHIAQAATQAALEDLRHVKPETIEPFATRIEYQIALAETKALLGDPDGQKDLEAARAEADKQGFPGLVLAARLAHVEIAHATGDPAWEHERAKLAMDARAHHFPRIAQLAETVEKR